MVATELTGGACCIVGPDCGCGSGRFLLAIVFMAASFFTLMVALSWADVSLVVPASAACTFLTNAIAATLPEGGDPHRPRYFIRALPEPAEIVKSKCFGKGSNRLGETR